LKGWRRKNEVGKRKVAEIIVGNEEMVMKLTARSITRFEYSSGLSRPLEKWALRI
jgi:hypothetical protein